MRLILSDQLLWFGLGLAFGSVFAHRGFTLRYLSGVRYEYLYKKEITRAEGEARPNGMQLILISKDGREGSFFGVEH